MPSESTFRIAIEDFDRSLLSDPTVVPGTDLFTLAVSAFFAKQFEAFGGVARVVVNDTQQTIEVRWSPLDHWMNPKEKTKALLDEQRFEEALPLLATLVYQHPGDPHVRYQLGLVQSELGDYAKAADTLERVVEIDPNHVHALTALGVAEVRTGNLLIGESWLRKAMELSPHDPWVLRNLGACLMKQERFEEARSVLESCLAIAPDDVAVRLGLADALEALDETTRADGVYREVLQRGGPEFLMDLARRGRSKIAERTLRKNPSLRLDVLTYMQDGLERFASMSDEEVQKIGMEIAMRCSRGMNIHDVETKHTLVSMKGNFTGLQLVSLMYVAFQRIAPEQDLGIDLAAEYRVARSLQNDQS